MSCTEQVSEDCGHVQPRSVFYMLLNLASSISIVLVNKWLFNNCSYEFPTFLTMLHFAFTFLGLQVCAWMGLFTPKPLALWRVARLSSAFCGFVVLTNISLQLNSVGFYQVMKVLTTPVIAVLQLAIYGTTLPRPIVGSLAVVCMGVTYSSITDTEVNLHGTLVACAGVLVTSFYQIWVGTEQKELEANALQLLYYQAPVSALMLLPVIPLLDDVPGLLAFEYTSSTLGFVVASCSIALFVNLSTFLVIGATSPITYNVLGHFKLSLVVVGGFLVFGYHVDVQNILGMCVVFVGVIWYTHLKLRAGSAERAVAAEAAQEKESLLGPSDSRA
ncbi:triose-phosphate transporter family-domain-containing protein [Pavlovales sp. CCMP2436]|nr:triose-phosphate transporter family-domain-containing protein [Pavlovales sp. CCMP2436]